jgi:hypothetical protein
MQGEADVDIDDIISRLLEGGLLHTSSCLFRTRLCADPHPRSTAVRVWLPILAVAVSALAAPNTEIEAVRCGVGRDGV